MTQKLHLTTAWTDITAAASLATGKQYLAQGIGQRPVILCEAASTPDTDTDGITLAPGEKIIITPVGAGLLYARSVRATSILILTEAE